MGGYRVRRRRRGRRVCGAKSERCGRATCLHGMYGGTSIARCQLRSYHRYVSASSWNLWSHDCNLQCPEQLEGRNEPPVDKVDYRRSPRLQELLGASWIAHVKQSTLDEDWTPHPHASPMIDCLSGVLKEQDTQDSLYCLLKYNSNDDARLGDEVVRLDLCRLVDPVGI